MEIPFKQSFLRVTPMQVLYIAFGLVFIFSIPIPMRWLPLVGVVYFILCFSSYRGIPVYDWVNIIFRYRRKITFPEGKIIQVLTPVVPVAIAQDSELVSIIAVSGVPSYPMVIDENQVWTKNKISEEFISQLLKQYDFHLSAIDIVQVIPPILHLQGIAAQINHTALATRKTYLIIRSNPSNWNNLPALKLRGGDSWAAIRAHAAAVARIQLRLKESGLRARVLSKQGIKNYRLLSAVDSWRNKWGAVVYRGKFRYVTLCSSDNAADTEYYLRQSEASEIVHCVRIEHNGIRPISTHLFRYRTYGEKVDRQYKELMPLHGLQKELLYYIQGYGVKFPAPLPTSGNIHYEELITSAGGVFLGLSRKNNPVFLPLVDPRMRLNIDFCGSKQKLAFILNNVIDTHSTVLIITMKPSSWLAARLSPKINVTSLKEFKETIKDSFDVLVLDGVPFIANLPPVTVITISDRPDEQSASADVFMVEQDTNRLFVRTRSIIFDVTIPEYASKLAV